MQRHRASVDAPGTHGVEVTLRSTPKGFTWRIANTSASSARVRSVDAVCTLSGQAGRLRMFRNGWQSSSETSVATLGVDVDPATTEGALELQVMSHHPDARGGRPDRLRSEMVTVVADDHGAVLAGFLGGDLHDGTIWLAHGQTGQEIRLQAYLGGAVLAPGEERELHEVWIHPVDEPLAALEAWATEAGRRGLARVRAPRQVGWRSWNHYFEHVRELDIREALSAAADWPIDVVRLDDGYQAAVGDWLITSESFPSGLAPLATAIDSAGCRPGIWLAPFLVAPRSRLADDHPDWIAGAGHGDPLVAMYNAHWGGFVYTLDTSHPGVQQHLEDLARAMSEMGYGHFELDFTHAPGMHGAYHDLTLTPAQRVRAGYDAFRRGAGDDAFILGSGAPLGATVGVVDAMRIGPDVAQWWSPRTDLWDLPGYMGTVPATVNAWRNTLSRSFMHRRLWVNDPGCLMLDSEDTDLSEEQLHAWAMAVAVSGAMVVLGDDLAGLDRAARDLFETTLDIGRDSDASAVAGNAARCDDLMTSRLPQRLSAAGHRLDGEAARGFARVMSG